MGEIDMPCVFAHVFALVVVVAVWVGTDATLQTKLILTAILAVIWGVGFLWPYAFLAMPLFAGFVYFLFFGSEGGRRWRP
jgi:hypothetical protein